MGDVGVTGLLMIISAAVTIAAAVVAVRRLVRWLAARSPFIAPASRGRSERALSAAGYVAALATLPFAPYLGVTIGGTLSGGLGDTLVRHYGAAVGVGLGLGAVTLLVTALAAVLGMLLCALILRVVQK